MLSSGRCRSARRLRRQCRRFHQMGRPPASDVRVHYAFHGHGDVGYAEHYARAFHRTRPDGDKPAADYVVNVRYIDRMERRNGEWRIADRMIAFETERSDPTEWT